MADRGCNHLRPDAGFFDAYRRQRISGRQLLVDGANDGTPSGYAIGERYLHPDGHHRLQPGYGHSQRNGEQAGADDHGVKPGGNLRHCSSDHYADLFGICERRDGHFADHSPNLYDDVRHDQPSGQLSNLLYGSVRFQLHDQLRGRIGDSDEGDADGGHVANGEYNRCGPDAGFFDTKRRQRVSGRWLCLDDAHNSA